MSTPNLDQRNANENVNFQDCTPCGSEFPVGCTVTLKCDEVSIIATVKSCDGDTITGIVQAFQNWNQPEWNGWCSGTEITFNESNVFCCNTSAVAA